MKKAGTILFFLGLFFSLKAQTIRVMVPKGPVVAGTAFQLQYVITNPSELLSVSSPFLNNTRLVSGPNHYKGTITVDGKPQAIENITYTLVSSKEGLLKIKGITANFKNGKEQKTADALVTIVPPPKASYSISSNYTDVNLYAPVSETDLQKMVDENLFIKTKVDRTTCFVGEPIVASFKLYSRLQSTSEAEKSPGFYGFSVVDMLDIKEAHLGIETINGKVYNTSVLRKVQLYPSQSGPLTIDELYVQNEIEFDDSLDHTNKKTLTKELVTKPVLISVKPLPKKQPPNYTGAVGNFRIEASLAKKELPENAQNTLTVIISGSGNFIQFGQPAIEWPKGMEPFEPLVADQLNRLVAPTEGKRIYEFSFTTNSAGAYMLPPVSFSFFDPQADSFTTIRSDSLPLTVLPAAKKTIAPAENSKARKRNYVFITSLISLLFLAIILFIRRNRKKKTKPVPVTKPGKENYVQKMNSLDTDKLSDRQACLQIQQLLARFIKEEQPMLSREQSEEVNSIKSDCQLLIYSSISLAGKKEELKKRAVRLLRQLKISD
jgi:hypothetical protein